MTFLNFIHRYIAVFDRMRYSKKYGYLPTDFAGTPHIITPRYAKSSDILQLDDKRFVIDATDSTAVALFWVGTAVGLGIFLGIVPSIDLIFDAIPDPESDWFDYFAVGFSILYILALIPPVLLAFFYVFKRPKKRLKIWDRENGTVTLPPRFWGEHEVVPFKDLKVRQIRNLGSYVNFTVLAAYRPSDNQPIEFGLLQDNEKDWAFFCWYMDKDRPLPPGEVFDPYRERDDARRKREMVERLQKFAEEEEEALRNNEVFQGRVLLWKE